MNLAKAISYARFSSGVQAKGSSLERQAIAFATWLEQHRGTYEPLYFSDKGVSAFKGRNAADGDLARLLKLVRDGVIKAGDLLVIESIDRLSRQATLDSFDLIRDVVREGVNILTLENGQVYSKESLNGAEIFTLIANIQAAHNYSCRLGERVSAAHEAKRKKARAKEQITKVVTVPWIEGTKLKEPFASLVKNAIALYLKGLGTRQIVLELRPEISANPELAQRYSRLNATTIRKWLNSIELVGHWGAKGGIIENCFEPLISNVQFQQIEQETKRRRKTPSKANDYELSGLVRCQRCAGAFHTRRQKVKNKQVILYCNCANYLKNGNCDNNSTWPYQVLLYIYRYGLTSVLAEAYMAKNAGDEEGKQAALLAEEIAGLELRLTRVEKMYEATGASRHLETIVEIANEIRQQKGRVAKLNDDSAAKQAIAFGDAIHDLSDLIELPLLELRALLKQFNYQILVNGKEARLSSSPEGREIFTLVRRVQRHVNAYILRVSLPEIPDPTENHWTKYYAIDSGAKAIACAATEGELLEKIKDLGSLA